LDHRQGAAVLFTSTKTIADINVGYTGDVVGLQTAAVQRAAQALGVNICIHYPGVWAPIPGGHAYTLSVDVRAAYPDPHTEKRPEKCTVTASELAEARISAFNLGYRVGDQAAMQAFLDTAGGLRMSARIAGVCQELRMDQERKEQNLRSSGLPR
jgi:hypothetical protein